MPDDIEIRPATPADAAALADLANALDRDQGGEGNVHSAATVLRDGFGTDPAVRFVVATKDGAAVGYAMFSRFYNSDTARTGSCLNDIYVVPAMQRSGLGRRLIAAVAAETARRGGTFVWTGVYTANAAGRAFYRAMGARDEDARIVEIDGESFRRLQAVDFAACGGLAGFVSQLQAILIAGPTASGKSALALRLAERLDGTVVNADSMQVYCDLALITARPTPEEQARIPHLLYGHVNAAVNHSVGRWCEDARRALAEIAAAGRLPILVGGTGLYFKALTQGLSHVPPTPQEIRAAVRARCDAEGAAALHAELLRRDPKMAVRLKPGDRMRVSRALEVLEATGRSLADWHREGMPAILDPDRAIKLFLAPERAALYRRIDARFDAMLTAGALEEVRALAARNLDPMLPAMKAHGVPWLIRHLRGEIGLAEAAEQGKRDTRRYTKRQLTWFRNQMPGWTWVAPEEAEDAAMAALKA